MAPYLVVVCLYVHSTIALRNTIILQYHHPYMPQVFNMFNSRKINDELNVFENIHKSKLFWIVFVIMCGAQVIIMQLIPGVFKVDSQTWEQWLIAIAIGIGSIPFALLVKLATRGIRTAMVTMRRTPARPDARSLSQMPVLQRNDSRRSEVSITASSTAAEEVGDVVRTMCRLCNHTQWTTTKESCCLSLCFPHTCFCCCFTWWVYTGASDATGRRQVSQRQPSVYQRHAAQECIQKQLEEMGGPTGQERFAQQRQPLGRWHRVPLG